MRLLHTSDWHLGQSLHQYDRAYEHQAFLDWLLDTLEAERVDALLVSGDIFDTANPPAAAQLQFYRFLTEARRRVPHLNAVMIAGNHDSPGRLEAPAPLLATLDAAIIGQVRRTADGTIDAARLVVPLRDRHGAVAAWCLAIPFLRPADVPRVDGADDQYSAGVSALYRLALDVALAQRAPGQAIVALGHCHVTGGQVSESERPILLGGAEAMSSAMFDPRLAYVALGHLHLAQLVGGRAEVRYSGSPLPMSFAEADYRHQVLRVDIEGEAVHAIQALPVPRSVALMRLPAAAPEPALAALAALDLPGRPLELQPYLQVSVVLDSPEPGLRARVEAALEGKAVRLARIETHVPGRAADDGLAPTSLEDVARLEPADVFRRLHRQRFGADPADALMNAFHELAEQAATDSPP